ncbi:transcriptional regulator [Catellatospora sp. IY07-71]|uniref:helix-turn-helix transcriptional regulator n=1 Tax=Catellatospora sp. IY07-71 TaxID=2728827 RepID=UPI001BB36676|nr:helix-turn-helix transcriptional regulator [Catellatospora sp. IY07-71]BCJ73627.1 transcriptional regulator [Catellatospora sp. IY07-71]
MNDAAAARRAELGLFLRTMRAAVTPADVGLTPDLHPGRRRTPGLRREEVAELAGVSLTWYTWLEQGRDVTPSSQVVDALARALRLDDDKHQHLRRLAGPIPMSRAPQPRPHRRLQRLVDAQGPVLAVVYDRYFDYLVWNSAYAERRVDPLTFPADRRNMLWMMFTHEPNRAALGARWTAAACAVLSQFRIAAGEHPGDPRYAYLVDLLRQASPEFAQWWAEYDVRPFRAARLVLHGDAADTAVDVFQLRLVDEPELLMVLQVPAPDLDGDIPS